MLEHNVSTLNELEEYTAQGKNCCVVNPCGSGKTSVMAEYIFNHRDKTIVVFTRQKNAKAYYESRSQVFKSVKVVTYSKMQKDCHNGRYDSYKADIYILDEAHYIGAFKWGAALDRLCSLYHPIIVGFTATPQRFSDQGTDETIVEQYFQGNSAGNFTTKDLQNRGVFIEPEYILSLYDLQKDVETAKEKVEGSDLSEKQKIFYIEKLNHMLAEWEKTSNPTTVMSEALPRYMYKDHCNRILVYIPDISTLGDRRKTIDGIIRKIFGKKVASYEYTYRTTENELNLFLQEDKNYIKILYSIDKIMETIHIDDLAVMLMLRPSVSNRIITQQFGRINSIGADKKGLIIDMVDNLSNLGSINFIGGEGTSQTSHTIGSGLKLPTMHINRYASLFDEIDSVIRHISSFEYKGFKGSISQLCNIFYKNIDDVRVLLDSGFNTEDAFDKASTRGHCNVTPAVFNGYREPKEFTLTDEDRRMTEKYIPLVDRFIKRYGIEDEDMAQDLYVEMMYLISHTNKRGHVLGTYLNTKLAQYYIKMCRERVAHDNLWSDIRIETLQESDPDSVFHEVLTTDYKKILAQELNRLDERKRKIIFCRFYLGLTLEETGHYFGVNKERVRQLEAKTLRVLRYRSGRIRQIRQSEVAEYLERPRKSDLQSEPFADIISIN